jgi:hypothetical protein
LIQLAPILILATLGAAEPQATPPPAPPAASATPAPGSPRIRLKWTTASEVDNYGYFVHRGDAEEGPFKVLNPRAIPGAGNSELPSNYVYEDHAVEPGKTYFYWVESVSTRGEKEKFTPVIKRLCCQTPKPDDKPADKPAVKPEDKPAPKS